MKVVAVFVFVSLGLAKSSTIPDVTPSQECIRSEVFNDYIEYINEGEVWKERCRSCRCEGGSISCTLDAGKTCDRYYDSSMDRKCVEWDADECCCLKVGCEIGDKVYALGEEYTVEEDQNCRKTCICSAFVTECMSQCVYDLVTAEPQTPNDQ